MTIPLTDPFMAKYYRSKGRYDRALEYWQKAWIATKDLADPNSRQVADFTAAYWSHLLTSLGRVDELDKLMAAVQGRPINGQEYQRLLGQARNALATMKINPGISYRCGTLALFHVARALGIKTDFSPLADLDSPATGFSMSRLMELVQQYQLGLVAVQRPSGGELVVPSVVHWNQNHYAAIVEKRNGLYRVIDPTFGRPQWLRAGAINEGASGNFMVPAQQIPAGWQQISQSAAAHIFGKGLDSNDPPPPPPPCPSGDPAQGTCPICPPGGSNNSDNPNSPNNPNNPLTGKKGYASPINPGGGVANGGPCNCSGMPVWEVQEPYISVWLHDKPMAYNTSMGKPFELALDYHQRELRPVQTNAYGASNSWQVFNFGPNWNCNHLTYLDVTDEDGDTNYSNYNATQYCPDGGQRNYDAAGDNQDTRTYTQFSIITSSGSVTGFELQYPNGAQAIFGLLATVSILTPETLAMITKVVDPQGHVMQYQYSTNNKGVS